MTAGRLVSQYSTRIFVLFVVGVFWIFSLGRACAGATVSLSPEEIQRIGERVFENECASRDKELLAWNEGEEFLSCGIAHFIWYPRGYRGPFEESFPRFLDYARAQGVAIPDWLKVNPAPPCPWVSRDDFLSHQKDSRIADLRGFLTATKPLQASFIAKRMEDSLDILLENIPAEDRQAVRAQFERVASTPLGIYALADYVNFKGLGVLATEQYRGKGWGLLQALRAMRHAAEAPDALGEFTAAAKQILSERVRNAPPERNEERWLTGWHNRIDSYLKP